MFGDVYNGKRVLVTGHSGFKGSWLAMWLRRLGAEVCGIALPPETEVWASAIDRNAFSLCDKLLLRGNRAVKETELCSIYRF